MTSDRKIFYAILTLLVGAGIWLADQMVRPSESSVVTANGTTSTPAANVPSESAAEVEQEDDSLARPETKAKIRAHRQLLINKAKARQNQFLARFRNPEMLREYLDKVRARGGKVLGVIPKLGVAQIGYDSEEMGDLLREDLPEEVQPEWNFLVSIPAEPEPINLDGQVPFGTGALDWIGVPKAHQNWGAGVKVAVLDTYVQDIPGSLDVKQLETPGMTSEKSASLHGSSVASILSSVAPGAEILGIQVLNDQGMGDIFGIAQGISEAVDRGARVINLSLGSQGESTVLRDAIDYASRRNVVVVAAAGNEGTGSVSYPAKWPNVVAVTSVDGAGKQSPFANYGPEIDVAAPGIKIAVPVGGGAVSEFSGTSSSTPFVSGMLAQILSETPNVSAEQARRILIENTRDAGAPGQDPIYGAGILNASLIENRDEPGIRDLAVTDYYIDPKTVTATGLGVTVTIQNQGTTALPPASLQVTSGGRTQNFTSGVLNAKQVQSFTVYVDAASFRTATGLELSAVATLPAGVGETNLGNNGKRSVLRASGP